MNAETTKDLILIRMQRLMCIGLEGQPSAEMITGTGRIWIEVLSQYSPERLAVAFNTIERTANRWPTPAKIIESLPTYAPPVSPPVPTERQIAPDPEELERRRAKAKAAIEELARRFGDTSEQDDEEKRVEAERARVRAEIARRESAA